MLYSKILLKKFESKSQPCVALTLSSLVVFKDTFKKVRKQITTAATLGVIAYLLYSKILLKKFESKSQL